MQQLEQPRNLQTEPMDTFPQAIVIIPTLNEAANIGTLIELFAKERTASFVFDIAVVDGGSTDGTVDIVKQMSSRFPFVHFRHNERRIQSVAVNMAAQEWSHCEIMIRCDAHSGYRPGFLRGIATTLLSIGADSVVVPMDSVGSNPVSRAIAWLSDTPVGSGGSAHRGGTKSGYVDHGHHAAFRLARFLELGGYDETFTHNEDAEYDCRLRKSGGRIYMDSAHRITYFPRKTLTALARQYFSYGRGRSRTVMRHPESLRLRQLLVPANSVAVILSCLWFLFDPSILASALPLAYLGALFLVSLHLAVKNRSASGLLVLPAAVLMHFSWAIGFLTQIVRTKREQLDAKSLSDCSRGAA